MNRFERLVFQWLKGGLNLQHQQPVLGPLRLQGEERERCARQLARRLGIHVRVTNRDDPDRRAIRVG